MRAIAEEAFAMVRDYKGSHSGEHGDGIVRSEFHEFMFGKRLVQRVRGGEGHASIRRACSIPARSCARRNSMTARSSATGRTIAAEEMKTALDWSAYPGAGGGFQGAVEMCNNNGACRKIGRRRDVPVLSRHARRARRDARARQLAAARDHRPARARRAHLRRDGARRMKLCVSCKGCRRECPTGVDMARMKIEVQAARAAKHGLSLRDRLVGWLPRYAPLRGEVAVAVQCARHVSEAAANCRSGSRASARGARCRTGARIVFARPGRVARPRQRRAKSCCFADTFNRYFERENLDAAVTVLQAGRLHACISPSPPTARSARSAAAARSSRSAGRSGAARGRARDRGASRRSSRAACRWSGWSRAAFSASATKCRR